MISTRNDDNLRPFTDSYGPKLAGVHFYPRRAKKVSDLKTRQSIKCMILILYGLPHQLWNNYAIYTLTHTHTYITHLRMHVLVLHMHTHTHTHTYTYTYIYIYTYTYTYTCTCTSTSIYTCIVDDTHTHSLSLHSSLWFQGNSAHSKQSVWKRVETTGNPFHGMILTAPTRARRARTSLM